MHVRVLALAAIGWLAVVATAATKPAKTAAPAVPPPPAGVQFSPSGTVKHVRQAVARFPRAMVPFGDPNPKAAPFHVDCPSPGTARWLEPRTWVYDFVDEVPGGVACTFTLDAAAAALDGTPVPGPHVFRFDSGGPAVLSTVPSDGDTISEDQTFVLVLDALPAEATLSPHLSFAIDGVAERVGFDVVTGSERDAVLKEQHPHPEPGERMLVVRARRRFPNDADVRLVWGQGIAAASGPATTEDQTLSWTVRPAFTATHYCQRLTKEGPCLPITPMSLHFSSPVPRARLGDLALMAPDGTRIAAVTDDEDPASFERVTFRGPFAEATTYRIVLPADLVDDEGRTLGNADRFPMDVKIGPFPPLAKFATRFGLLEAKAQPAVPVTVRNIEPDVAARLRAAGAAAAGQQLRVDPSDPHELIAWMRRVAVAGREHSIFTKATGPAPAKFAVPTATRGKSMEVIGVPLERPGLHVVEIESLRLGAALLAKPKPMFVAAAALVTNMAVHLKRGRDGSLVWVTALDTGAPVAGASVTLVTCSGAPVWSGETDADGIARLGALPGLVGSAPSCPFDDVPDDASYDLYDNPALRAISSGWFAIARRGDDVSLVHSDWNDGIEPWRFQISDDLQPRPFAAHTVFDRALFRVGETVHMKHVLRARTLQGLEALPQNERPTKLEIRHEGSNQTWELPLLWDAAGSAESTWPIPDGAKLGTYDVRLVGADWDHSEDTGSFRVEEFRLPLLRATLKAPAAPQIATAAVTIDATVQYLAGGPAGALPVTLRALLDSHVVDAPDDFASFRFGEGAVKEGVEHGDGGEDEGDGETASEDASGRTVHQRLQATLDANGAARLQITDLPPAAAPRDLRAELEYRDPSGEVHTAVTTLPLWPSQWIAGVHVPEFDAAAGTLGADVGVIDTAGKPVAHASVKVVAFQELNYSIRKRVVGGVYSYEYVTERKKLGAFCDGTTDAAGRLHCAAPPPARGTVILEATVTDPGGHVTASWDSTTVAGDRDMNFRVGDTDRIDVIPDKRQYEPGETAHLEVRMPFRAATALVAVEREGVRTATVVSLTNDHATVDVPVTAADAPNVFVSVLAVRGRVGDVQPTAMVDLGRPAFKLGIAELKVGWQSHQLRVGVAAARPVYHVREQARVKVAVQSADGSALPPGGEVMIAAVDEALLDLAPNDSWQLLGPMMGHRSYGVATATASMQVVGKRHFGQKAKPSGGGGGRQPTRELFDTLLLWKARVPLDGRGRARVDVPLNDSLTSFRIVAVATVGLDRFGTGKTSIRSTQDLMLLSGLPPVVRDGDRLQAEMTVRNTTDRPLDVTVTPTVDGLVPAPPPATLTLAPGEAHPLVWDVTVPAGPEQLRWDVVAAAAPGMPRDQLKVAQTIKPAVPVTTIQGMLYRADAREPVPVQPAAGALPERGDVEVQLRPRLADGLDGVRQAMREYPYECLEQQVSRAVTLDEPARWGKIVDALPSYVDRDGLFKFFPGSREGSEVLTAYVLSVSRAAGWTLPPSIRDGALQALRQYVEGGLQRTPALAAADRTLRKLSALDALARFGQADAALVSTLAIEPNLWPTSALLDWWNVLRRVPKIPDAARRKAEVEQIVRARLNQQGTVTKFTTEDGDFLWWLMTCPDGNAARLVLDRLDANEWRDDLPKLMAGTVARQRHGAWGCTTANAWGRLASDAFTRAFESTPVTGRTTVQLGTPSRDVDWSALPKGDALHFPWPASVVPLAVTHAGTGSPWVTVRGRAAIPLTEPVAHGYRVTRTMVPVERRRPDQWSRGDIVRVELEIAADATLTWVVVSDPIPAGASHLGTGLGGAPTTGPDAVDENGVEPSFVERGFEGLRAYYEVLPGGRTTLAYTIRLNQAGTFQQPPTHVEAMYDPDVEGDAPNPPFVVAP